MGLVFVKNVVKKQIKKDNKISKWVIIKNKFDRKEYQEEKIPHHVQSSSSV